MLADILYPCTFPLVAFSTILIMAPCTLLYPEVVEPQIILGDIAAPAPSRRSVFATRLPPWLLHWNSCVEARTQVLQYSKFHLPWKILLGRQLTTLPPYDTPLYLLTSTRSLRLSRPKLVSNLPHKLQLLPHVFISESISLCMAGKAALGADTDLTEGLLPGLSIALGDEIRSLVDTLDHFVSVF